MQANEQKAPSLKVSLFPVFLLIFLLVVNIIIFKDSASAGPNQIVLLVAGVVTGLIGVFVLNVPYQKIEHHMVQSIQLAMQACIILLVVGSLIGVWILSGIVPTLIFYGLNIINPTVFLPVACIVCAIVSLATGSSWSTTGTVGIALIGIGSALGIPIGMVAGAIISGAYFGDKMSPLSDTTNLAPAMAGTDLFTHIRHMMYTSIPAIVISLVLFTIIGLFSNTTSASVESINEVLSVMEQNFTITPWLFLVPLAVIIMVAKKVPALPALCGGIVSAVIFGIIFQNDLMVNPENNELTITSIYTSIIKVAFGGFSLDSGNKVVDSLLSRGGMEGMLGTIWLILSAMVFGGTLEATGMLQKLAASILKSVRGAGSLIGATIASCLMLNLTASDQYLAIVVPGRMFKKAYDDYGLHPKNLSRALEDSGTVTSVLIPWNSGGAYNSGVLGVATLTYLPYCFFNLLSPLISLFLATVGWTIEKKIEEATQSVQS